MPSKANIRPNRRSIAHQDPLGNRQGFFLMGFAVVLLCPALFRLFALATAAEEGGEALWGTHRFAA